MSRLPAEWIARVFQRLAGVYGAQFKAKYSQMENGVDVGIANASGVWAEELAGFIDHPEAIAYALKNLPSDHCPNAMQFKEICRRAPRKSEAVAAIEYKPTAEDIERQKQMARKASEAAKPKEFDGLMWAKRPKSQKAMDFVSDGKKDPRRFPMLADVFDILVSDGVCNAEGKLLKRWADGEWVKA